MPRRPLRPCRSKGCSEVHRNSNGYCETHKSEAAAWVRKKEGIRALTGRPWRRLRDRILERDKHLCQCEECKSEGRITLAEEVDHIIPISQGGTDKESNLRAISKECHKKKTMRESLMARGLSTK